MSHPDRSYDGIDIPITPERWREAIRRLATMTEDEIAVIALRAIARNDYLLLADLQDPVLTGQTAAVL